MNGTIQISTMVMKANCMMNPNTHETNHDDDIGQDELPKPFAEDAPPIFDLKGRCEGTGCGNVRTDSADDHTVRDGQ